MNVIYRIIEYGMANQFFKLKDLVETLSLTADEKNLCINTFIEFMDSNATASTNNILKAQGVYRKPNNDIDYNETTLTLLPTAVFQYTDYLEIVEARKNAEYAKEQSNRANTLSRWALILTIIIGLGQIGIAIYFGKN